jgi:hypothetical protein
MCWHPFQYAIFMDRNFYQRCRTESAFAACDGCRVSDAADQRFYAKFFTDSNSNRLAVTSTGIYSHAESDTHADSAATNKNYSEPDSNAHTVTHSDSHAAKQSQGESNANTRRANPRLDEYRDPPKTKPADFISAGPG